MRISRRSIRSATLRTPAALLAPALLLALAACASAPPSSSGAEPGAFRAAALARLVVDNRTSFRLRIGYRLAVEATPPVTVGTIAPQAIGTVAPVPAGEPLLLFAEREDGARYALPPLTLEIDELRNWTIPANAAFSPNVEQKR